MKLVEGMLDYTKTEAGHIYAFTANSMVYKDQLCMGGGAALAAREAYPNVDLMLGKLIIKHSLDEVYGSVVVPYDDFFVCAFQTKTHVALPSTLELVKAACYSLNEYMEHKYPDGNYPTVHLNYPAIGLGGLTPEEVGPIIESLLGDHIIVYK
jgi:hypothetical protein